MAQQNIQVAAYPVYSPPDAPARNEPHDERTIIKAAQGGSLEAFNLLVLRYQDTVYNVTYRILRDPEAAADAAQDTFIKAFQRLETYQGGNFRAWLLRVATNICLNLLRSLKSHTVILLDDLAGEDFDDDAPIPDPIATPEQSLQNSELNSAIQSCITCLTDDQRIALVMSDLEGYSYQEIADAANTQVGTIKSRLSRARAGVRKCLQSYKELLPPDYQ